MAIQATEARHDGSPGLDRLPAHAALAILAKAQLEAARVVEQAIPAIASAAEIVASRLTNGGRIVYAAAGSSGLMALADGLELPGTYGIARDRILILLAGGREALDTLAGSPEDDASLGARDIADARVGAADCVIAVSASGSTPYALGALDEANRRGAATVAIANNQGSPLLERAGTAILLATPPEVIAGSTRMGAGTAQKIALNMLSTMAAIMLGHVHDGFMVNLHADNAKLKRRAAGIVGAIAGIDPARSAAALESCGGSVKQAVLLSAGARDAGEAKGLLDRAGQSLRSALSLIEGSAGSRQNRI